MVISVVFPFDHCGQYCSQLLGSGFCRNLDFSALLVVLLGMELPCQNDNSVKRFEKLADCLKFLYWLKLLKIQAQQFKKKVEGASCFDHLHIGHRTVCGREAGPIKNKSKLKSSSLEVDFLLLTILDESFI